MFDIGGTGSWLAIGDSICAKLDNVNTQLPVELETTVTMAIGDKLRLDIIRDSSGHNSGGLFDGTPALVGLNPSVCAQFTVWE